MLRIKKLDKFIAKQFGLLFIGTFFICLFILMMQFLWKYVDELIGKGLTMDVLAQFFWYMSLMLVPQALPLAILLSSLITFGNLGESSELTAIKASGISLLQAFRSLIVIVIFISFGSFYFQNVIGPNANMSFSRLLLSMKQKSPELEIPEGVFYDGIPGCNLYVQKKDMQTGKLYGVMIYKMTDSYEDAAIILADSGMLQSTAEKKHLLLTLYSGEWFENMKSQQMVRGTGVPYRRETFVLKKILLDFDSDFNVADAGALSNSSKSKSVAQIVHDIDSLNHVYDSVGRAFYRDAQREYYSVPSIGKTDSLRAVKMAGTKTFSFDSVYSRLNADKKLTAVNGALNKVRREMNDLDFKGMLTSDGDRLIRSHKIEAINKYSVALQCILFFFIGAPLGAIIRKGGLGVPVIISVLVFIVFFIFDNSGYRMARAGEWTIWFGKTISLAVLTPLAVFFTYKANNDSVVFNIDFYRNLFMNLLGLRMKRSVYRKEVIINDPDYAGDAEKLAHINEEISAYAHEHNLLMAPSVVKVFFKYSPDHVIEDINARMEAVIEDLSNTKDKQVLALLNEYPYMAVKSHTRPFEHKWLNIAAAVVVPVGLFLYFRMWRFRLRLFRDLRVVKQTNDGLIDRINEMNTGGKRNVAV
ncbi:LptF/LptG family permease [Marseilla massiliensis]|uniref:LptF/LptG family permease n=1 Tax=Marseilla massiliensis TaxID=1841864 RepID=A0A938WT94_9BACT|nr:LptF/LptG family permease [Marseilla massiliensis]MBM6673296.1 LptF/LptG family permease [Marseilla massiliensis]